MQLTDPPKKKRNTQGELDMANYHMNIINEDGDKRKDEIEGKCLEVLTWKSSYYIL